MKELRRALANPVREKGGPAGIEGPNLLVEALRAGLRIHCVFAAEGTEGLLEELALPAETEILLVPQDVLRSALRRRRRSPLRPWSSRRIGPGDVLGGIEAERPLPLLLVLAGLQDPGNLGTILRSAEAFGANGVVCLPGTVSAWNPKAVRASAGSVFRVPVLDGRIEGCDRAACENAGVEDVCRDGRAQASTRRSCKPGGAGSAPHRQ